jgi:hypothetical protein
LATVYTIGQAWARILCNYARHIVLPLLGLQGNYEELEIVVGPEAKEHGHGCQETGVDDIVDISESVAMMRMTRTQQAMRTTHGK